MALTSPDLRNELRVLRGVSLLDRTDAQRKRVSEIIDILGEGFDPNFRTRAGIDVAVGQVWQDLDRRMNGRKVEIVTLGTHEHIGKVRIRPVGSRAGAGRWLSVKRMYCHSTGWKFVGRSGLGV